jgi:SAM-dependent methyltransferase
VAELNDIRETVRERYAAAATKTAPSDTNCCQPIRLTASAATRDVFGGELYDDASREGVPDSALDASLGCGVPTAVADLREGETVLDLGSGAGADVLISAGRVGPSGKVIGLDMTDEMLALARANASAAGVENVEFVKGYLEAMPLVGASIDVVISNCVINLSGDKPAVIREAARVLRPGGRFAVSDVIADPDMDRATRADMAAWTGCIAGALTEAEFRGALSSAGFEEIEIQPTHRVHQHASAAIIRARKPDASACCAPTHLASVASRQPKTSAAGRTPQAKRRQPAAAHTEATRQPLRARGRGHRFGCGVTYAACETRARRARSAASLGSRSDSAPAARTNPADVHRQAVSPFHS